MTDPRETDERRTNPAAARKDGVAPPSGSAHSGVEAPKTRSDRRWLYVAGAAVLTLLVVFLILPAFLDETVAPVSDEIGDVGDELPTEGAVE